MANLKNTVFSGDQFRLPVGNTAARPGSPEGREIRFNTETGKLEQFRPDVGEWIAPSNTGVIATGGDSVYDVDSEGTTYRVHVFNSTGTSSFSVSQGGEVEALIVAGGGGGGAGGGNDNDGCGGGGAGELLILSNHSVSPQNYAVTVGAGGAGTGAGIRATGSNGDNSVFDSFTLLGGGGGGGSNFDGNDGGSGGGAGGGGSNSHVAATNTAFAIGDYQGNNGGEHNLDPPYLGAGGGGAGAPGADDSASLSQNRAGDGGNGISSTISGISTFYAGGGGGGDGDSGYEVGNPGLGGLGGGQDGTPTNNAGGGSATPNTGGGGAGGGGAADSAGGDGGSGIVIIRYPLRQENPVSADGKVVGDGLVLDLDFAKPTVYGGSGTVVTDSRLNGIEGSINGASFVNSRTHRSAFDFDGNDAITLTGNSFIYGGNDKFSYSVWCKIPHSGNNQTIISYGDLSTPGAGVWLFKRRSGLQNRFTFHGYNSTNPRIDVVGSEIPDNQITFLTITFDGQNEYKMYQDGVLDVTTNGNQVEVLDSENNLFIGQEPNGGSTLIGTIYSISSYNRALTAEEVEQHFEATRWRFGV